MRLTHSYVTSVKLIRILHYKCECVRIRALYFMLYTQSCIYVEMDKDGVFLTTAVLPLAIKYTVVVKWRSPADRVAGLGGLTVQALCLSGYSHYPVWVQSPTFFMNGWRS